MANGKISTFHEANNLKNNGKNSSQTRLVPLPMTGPVMESPGLLPGLSQSLV